LPVSYWLELSRRALVGDVAHAFPTFANLSNGALLLLLLGMTVLLSFLALRFFVWCDRRARERGLIDRVTNY
jgi:ABC-2 type transport system permease protein